MHSSRMRTARSSGRPGGLQQPPPTGADPPTAARHAGIAHPPAARNAGIPPAMHAGIPAPLWTESQTPVKI